MIDIKNINLLDLIPPNLRNDPTIKAAAQAIDYEMKKVTESIKETIIYARIDELPEPVIDLLAWEEHVDFYDSNLPLDKKRALVKGSAAWHRHKGTPWAVEEVISAAFAKAKVIEWFEYDGRPGRFKIRTIDALTSDESYKSLVRAISTVKNTRSRLDAIEIHREINVGESGKKSLYFGFLSGKGGKETIGLPLPSGANITRNIGLANHIGGYKKINISLPTKTPVKIFAGVTICHGGKIIIGRSK